MDIIEEAYLSSVEQECRSRLSAVSAIRGELSRIESLPKEKLNGEYNQKLQDAELAIRHHLRQGKLVGVKRRSAAPPDVDMAVAHSTFLALPDEIHHRVAAHLRVKDILHLCAAGKGKGKGNVYRQYITRIAAIAMPHDRDEPWLRGHQAMMRLLLSARVEHVTLDVSCIVTIVRALEQRRGDTVIGKSVESMRVEAHLWDCRDDQVVELTYAMQMQTLGGLKRLDLSKLYHDPTPHFFVALSKPHICPTLEKLLLPAIQSGETLDALSSCMRAREFKQVRFEYGYSAYSLDTTAWRWSKLEDIEFRNVDQDVIRCITTAINAGAMPRLRRLLVVGESESLVNFYDLFVALCGCGVQRLEELALSMGSLWPLHQPGDPHVLATSITSKVQSLCLPKNMPLELASALLGARSWQTLPEFAWQATGAVAKAIVEARLAPTSMLELSRATPTELHQLATAFKRCEAFAGALEKLQISGITNGALGIQSLLHELECCHRLRVVQFTNEDCKFTARLGSGIQQATCEAASGITPAAFSELLQVLGGTTESLHDFTLDANLRQLPDVSIVALFHALMACKKLRRFVVGDGCIVNFKALSSSPASRLDKICIRIPCSVLVDAPLSRMRWSVKWVCVLLGLMTDVVKKVTLVDKRCISCRLVVDALMPASSLQFLTIEAPDYQVDVQSGGGLANTKELSAVVEGPRRYEDVVCSLMERSHALEKMRVEGSPRAKMASDAIWQGLAGGHCPLLRTLQLIHFRVSETGLKAMQRVFLGDAACSSSLKIISLWCHNRHFIPRAAGALRDSSALRPARLTLRGLTPLGLEELCALLAEGSECKALSQLEVLELMPVSPQWLARIRECVRGVYEVRPPKDK